MCSELVVCSELVCSKLVSSELGCGQKLLSTTEAEIHTPFLTGSKGACQDPGSLGAHLGGIDGASLTVN